MQLVKVLQARKIDRIAAAYAVVGWLLVQGASIVFPTFGAPSWALKIFIAAVFVGFPVALWIAWVAVPHPRKRGGTPVRTTGTDMALLVLLGLVVAASAMESGYLFWFAPTGRSAALPSPSKVAGRALAQMGPADKSVAIMPFENLSSDKDTGYFAAGIQDEILTRLTKIGSLKVISRTSTAHYASKPDNLPEIARQLGVANIVEGSVQKAANAVHINVQLVKAATDAHLWAEIYDRKLEDIFAVEGEVATAIANALSAQITGAEKQAITIKPTGNPEAYNAYLRALAFHRKTDFSPEDERRAELLLGQAVRLDPGFATAWALLAHVNALQFFNRIEPAEAHRNAARLALDTALRLRPELPEVQLEQGYYQYWIERNYEGARRRFEDLRIKWPNNAEILVALSLIARRQGQWDKSKAYADEAISLDPLAPGIRLLAISLHMVTRDYSGALRRIDDALNIWPDNPNFIGTKAFFYQQQGQLDRADELLAGLHPGPHDDDVFSAITTQAIYRRHYSQAISLLQDRLAVAQANASGIVMQSYINLELGDVRRLSGDAAGAKANYLRARDEQLTALKTQPIRGDDAVNLGTIYCRLGDRIAAMRSAERAVKLSLVSNDTWGNYGVEETRARIEACLGDRVLAIPALARLLKSPGYLTPALLRLDPDFDRLRGDSRFETLINVRTPLPESR